MPKTNIINPEESYTFADYFKLNIVLLPFLSDVFKVLGINVLLGWQIGLLFFSHAETQRSGELSCLFAR
ncbi:MAG: hypothetical protein AN483_18120 [Aphanizomenon flos-aquae MDT14a]|jgi:hypothetical protein|nr:hypothetical protein [Aphanizomenon flos-aquae UKL13-PB]MBO1061547.1 hypothetical protein [Aphanizomenon flos-aquae CP01]OBQ27969.1 MAG: hypothetical protein AN483_18120 [Aphanizomenon flos-aquae MDT14a]